MEYFFINKVGDEVVGYLQAVADGPTTLRIVTSRLAVEWQHTSIPASLLHNVHDFCRRNDFASVIFDAGAIPRVSLRLLQRCGFQRRDTRRESGRSMLEYEVATKAGPALGQFAGCSRVAAAVPAAGPGIAGGKSQRRTRFDRSAERNPR